MFFPVKGYIDNIILTEKITGIILNELIEQIHIPVYDLILRMLFYEYLIFQISIFKINAQTHRLVFFIEMRFTQFDIVIQVTVNKHFKLFKPFMNSRFITSA